MTFKECEKKVNEKEDLKALFDLWKKAHAAEVGEIKKKIKENNHEECDGRVFQEKIYKDCTVSSHFVRFFYMEKCKECAEIQEQTVWEYVLKTAFNEDGCVGNYDVPENGYKYIVLLKESNDSKKACIKDYIPKMKKECVNEWIEDWKEGRVSAPMLTKINNEFNIFFKKKHKLKCEDFTKEMAYINVNKRGGTERTQGRDRNAVINYANKYKKFILKEIDILSKENPSVTVFVCGLGKNYFPPLIRSLTGLSEKEIDDNCTNYEYVEESRQKKIQFVNIPHPSSSVKKGELFVI